MDINVLEQANKFKEAMDAIDNVLVADSKSMLRIQFVSVSAVSSEGKVLYIPSEIYSAMHEYLIDWLKIAHKEFQQGLDDL